jgi:hypothetical protein
VLYGSGASLVSAPGLTAAQQVSPSAGTSSTTAASSATPSAFTDPNGKLYNVYSNTGLSGTPLQNSTAGSGSQNACAQACDTATGCGGFTLDTSNNCVLYGPGASLTAAPGLTAYQQANPTAAASSTTASSTASPSAFTDPNGVPYNRFSGTPLLTTTAASLDACTQTCDTTSNCVGVNFDSSNNCVLHGPGASLVPGAGITAAQRQANSTVPASSASPSPFTDPNGVAYNAYSNTGLSGVPLQNTTSASLNACAQSCDAYSGCVGATFDPSSICALYGSGASPISSPGTTAVEQPNPSAAASSATPSPFTDGKGVQYNSYSNTGFSGTSLQNTTAGSLDAYAHSCDATPGCVEVAFSASSSNCALDGSGSLLISSPATTAAQQVNPSATASGIASGGASASSTVGSGTPNPSSIGSSGG